MPSGLVARCVGILLRPPCALLAVGILSALLAGDDMGSQGTFNRLHVVVFAGVVSLTIWVIYDLEMPRYGLIRVDNFDKTMLDVRADFQWPDAKPAS